MGKQLTLILGGARSGKSSYAQSVVEESKESALFVATATAGDEEMEARIAAHRSNRPSHWSTLEAPLQVGRAIREAESTPWVLIDCLTLLTSNVLFTCAEPVDESEFRASLKQEIDDLLDAYRAHRGEWLIVSNEVGLGLVPPDRLSRFYRDGLGWANQIIARAADKVIFLAAGIPMKLK